MSKETITDQEYKKEPTKQEKLIEARNTILRARLHEIALDPTR